MLRKKSSSTATLGCVPLLSAAKSTQPRVAVLLNPALKAEECARSAKLEAQRLKPHSFYRSSVVANATTHKDCEVLSQSLYPVEYSSCKT
jgi:hypothetical protein